MQIESIADHLDWVPLIAGWHWQEWGDTDPLGSLAQWTHGLYERTLRDQIPTTYVAVEQRQPVGSVTLVEHDMEIRVDLSPWLAGVCVRPRRAGRAWAVRSCGMRSGRSTTWALRRSTSIPILPARFTSA